MIEYSANIDKPLEIVWKHFLSKIEQPQNFVPGVSDVAIREKTNYHVIRSMRILFPDGSDATVVENITHLPYRVNYLIVDHPFYTGHVDNIAEHISDNLTRITYTMHWVNKLNGETFSNQDIVKNAVMKTIAHILAAESRF